MHMQTRYSSRSCLQLQVFVCKTLRKYANAVVGSQSLQVLLRFTFKQDSNAVPICAAHHVDVAHDSVHSTSGLDAHIPPM